MRKPLSLIAALAVGASLLTATQTAPPAAMAAPTTRPTTGCAAGPTFAGRVPTPGQVLGFELGSRPADVSGLNRYLARLDRASDRVVVGTYGRTALGTPLKYALVGSPKILAAAQRGKISATIEALRNPATSPAKARALAESAPEILWLVGNVHGNEPASMDAQMRVLHELADRTDCDVTDILDNALVVVLPSQNPDGRSARTRVNSAAFDLNRDWFARTQPETRARLDLMRRFPPQVFTDQHGMGGTGYYFPPNADPFYHEAPRQAVGWMNRIVAPGNSAAFDARGWSYETYQAGYDLFYPGYGDTSPTLNHGAAGMTQEVGQAASFTDQVEKHYTAAMATLVSAARARRQILGEYHEQFVEAAEQGRRCELQPNAVHNPGNTVTMPVPQRGVCGYFLRADDPARVREVSRLVSRLQQDRVDVYRLKAPVQVPDFKGYGRAAKPTVVPAGTYWVPMDQPQKHWIQAMLGEDTYVPFAYFYDVSGWSMPLLQDVEGGSTSTRPAMRLVKVGRTTVPAASRPAGLPSVGVLTRSESPYNPDQSTGWIQWRLSQDWKIPATTFQPHQISAAGLSRLDVLLIPDIDATALKKALGDDGNAALTAWVKGGGHLVTWRGGTHFAALAGLTSTVLTSPKTEVPGALVRFKTTRNAPVTRGTGAEGWAMYGTDPIMKVGRGEVLASYPAADSPDWFVSGYAEGVSEIAGSAAVIDEQVGQGHVTVFSFEPNFRAFTDGSATLLRNAVLDSRGVTPRRIAPPATTRQRAAARKAAAAMTVRPRQEKRGSLRD